MIVIKSVTKTRPADVVVSRGDPNAEHIVDIAAEEEQTLTVFTEKSCFPNCVEDGGVWRCGGSAHGTAGDLLPEGVAELNDVVVHYQSKSVNERIDGNVSELSFVGLQVAGDLTEGWGCLDVGVHRYSVGGEESRASREV